MPWKNVKNGWIFGPRADFWVFVGPILVSLVFLGFHYLGLFGFDVISDTITPGTHYYAIQTYINMAHVYFIFWFTYASRKQWMHHRKLFIGVPLLVLVCNLVAGYFGGAWFVTIMFAHFTMWHFIKQQQAWFHVSAGKGSPRDKITKWIDTTAIIASTVGFAVASQSRPDSFGWFLPSDIVEFPHVIYWPVLALTYLSLLTYFVWHAKRTFDGHPINWNAHTLLLISAFIWGFTRLGPGTPFSYYLSQLAHSIPYFFLGFRFMQVQREQGEGYYFPKIPIWLITLGVILVAGQLGHLEMQMRFGDSLYTELGKYRNVVVLSFFNAINVTHYTLDKYFWDRGHNPEWLKALY